MRGARSPRAGQQHVAAAHDEGVAGAQTRCQGVALGVGERTHEDRWSHAFQRATFSTTFDDYALGIYLIHVEQSRQRVGRIYSNEYLQAGAEARAAWTHGSPGKSKT
jgi:hypothetical protein